MRCPKCATENELESLRCVACGDPLTVAVLEVVRGALPDRIRFLRPRPYSIGRGDHNDLVLNERSISKSHARLEWYDGRFLLADAGSLHGVYIDGAKVTRAELAGGAQIQLGNLTLRFSLLGSGPSTGAMRKLPWIEQEQLLLSLVQTLNANLVLGQVLEQVLAAIMQITGAERGFLLLADSSADAARYPAIAGLRLRVARGVPNSEAPGGYGISTAVVSRAIETGEVVTTQRDDLTGASPPAELPSGERVVCAPLTSPRSAALGGSLRALGVVYVDNAASAAPFSSDALDAAEALARHAALAIENAQLFESEQRTIEELQRTQKRLLHSEKLATIGQMSAGIGHELNTPLTYILGNLELLGTQNLTPAQREMISAIARGADRIRTLAGRLLAFSRPEQEQMVPLVLNDLVERSLELCLYQVSGTRVAVVRRLASNLPRVLGVSSELETAVINLVVNGLHAMHETGGTLTVSTRPEGGDVQITVSDEGSGIPPEIRSSLFEPFVTTKTQGEGTGLGLSTVLMVVERHRGRIDFETAPGRGTTFRITLPAIAS